MTSARHRAYQHVHAALDALPPGMLDRDENHALRDAAEGLLLVRPGEEAGHDRLLEQASQTLSVLFGTERMSAAQSESLWAMLAACGPDRPSAARTLRRKSLIVG